MTPHLPIPFPRLMIGLVLIVFLAGCAPAAPTPTPPAYWPTQGWQSTTPEEQGMDSETLAQMAGHIQKEKLDLHSLLIVRNGFLVDELYVYPYSAAQAQHAWSTTKSVISALVGIAIQQGYIKDVQQPLLSLLPDREVANLDDRKKAIRLEDLLTQTSGLRCTDTLTAEEASELDSADWTQFNLDQPMVAQPGKSFNYCTGATHLLSAVLQQATGMSAREFANQTLFGPLGIGPIQEDRWWTDAQGVSLGGYGLSLTPQEMAKLGLLYLNQGQWDGQPVVPAGWVRTSTSSHTDRGDRKEYGYLWWTDPGEKWYAALGRAGQHVFVYPAENLVVVSTADLPYTNDADLLPIQELLDGYILPAVKSDHALPPNPDGVAHLQAGLQALSEPQTVSPQPLPAIASQVSGKTYTFEENPLGWETIIFTFEPGADEARATVNGARQLRMGLDNAYRFLALDDTPFPQGTRGRWESPDTFLVESINLGQLGKSISHIQFAGESVHVTLEDPSSGGSVELQGTLEPASP